MVSMMCPTRAHMQNLTLKSVAFIPAHEAHVTHGEKIPLILNQELLYKISGITLEAHDGHEK